MFLFFSSVPSKRKLVCCFSLEINRVLCYFCCFGWQKWETWTQVSKLVVFGSVDRGFSVFLGAKQGKF